MPSIVPFGKFFCRYFVLPKFLRDFQRFRHSGTRLLYSVQGCFSLSRCSPGALLGAAWLTSAISAARPARPVTKSGAGPRPLRSTYVR